MLKLWKKEKQEERWGNSRIELESPAVIHKWNQGPSEISHIVLIENDE